MPFFGSSNDLLQDAYVIKKKKEKEKEKEKEKCW